MEIALEHLGKRYGQVAAVDDLSLQVREGEFVALLGPSGCGKTTTLLMLAGILRPTEGTIRFGERVVNALPPQERNIGMVFQSYALYPHMTAYNNIAYPLRLRKLRDSELHARVTAMAERLELAALLKRRPGELSGGQQQRVALARALVKQPDLLLFDEPLSNLDARLRLTTRSEIKRLQRDLRITSVYVTHDQSEALTMADRIAVLRNGRLESYATPTELYERPRTRFVAAFIGHPPMNLIGGELQDAAGVRSLRLADVQLPLPDVVARELNGAPREVVAGIRPEDLLPAADGELAGVVDLVEPLGREDLLTVRRDGLQLNALAPAGNGLQPGATVRLRVNMQRVHLFEPSSERSLLWDR